MSHSSVPLASSSMLVGLHSTPAASSHATQQQAIAPFNRLSADVQVMIWQKLHLNHRIAVLGVCKAWKTIATTAPHLWTSLEYCCVPKKYSTCNCKFVDGKQPGHSFECHFYPEHLVGLDGRRGSNLAAVKRALPLSGAMKLNLKLQITLPNDAAHRVKALAAALQPHAARIASIEIIAWSSEFPASLVDKFAQLPSLRRLTTRYVQRRPAAEYTPFTTATAALPALEEITFETLHTVLPDTAGFTLPRLRKLDFHVSAVAQIAGALRACPRLETIRAYLNLADGIYVKPNSPDVQTIAGYSAGLQSVWLEGVVPQDERWVLAAFANTALRSLEMAYEREKTPSLGWRPFACLAPGPIALDVAWEDPGELTIRATDALGMARAIAVTLPRHAIIVPALRPLFRALWRWRPGRLPVGSVTRLRLDMPAFDAFVAEFPRRNNVAVLQLVASQRWHITEFRLMDDTPTAKSRVFRAITQVSFVRTDRSLPEFKEGNVGYVEESLRIEVDCDGVVPGVVGAQPLTVELPARAR